MNDSHGIILEKQQYKLKLSSRIQNIDGLNTKFREEREAKKKIVKKMKSDRKNLKTMLDLQIKTEEMLNCNVIH
jgi:hypothetical protein